MKEQNSRTKACKKRFIVFSIISTLLFVGALLFSVISVFTKISSPQIVQADGSIKIISEEFKATCIGFGITAIICLFLTLFMSNKMRTTVWILSVIISTIIYGEVAMYSIFAVWFIDEYCFHLLAKHYREKLSINKEIDLRG